MMITCPIHSPHVVSSGEQAAANHSQAHPKEHNNANKQRLFR